MTSTKQDRDAYQAIVKQAMSHFQHELDLQVKNLGAYRRTFGNLCEAAIERLEDYAESKPADMPERVKDLLNPGVKTTLISFKQLLKADKVNDEQLNATYKSQLANIQSSLFTLFAYFGTAQNYKYTKANKVLPRCAGTYIPVVCKEENCTVENSGDVLCKNFFDPKKAVKSFMFDHSDDTEWFKTEQFKWDDVSSPMVCPSCVRTRLEHRVEKQKQTFEKYMKIQNQTPNATDVKGGLDRLKKLTEMHEKVLAEIPKYEAMMKNILYDESKEEEEEENEEEEDVDMAEAGGHAEASEEKEQKESEEVENVVVRKNEESEDNASQDTNGDKMEEDKVEQEEEAEEEEEERLPKTPVLPEEPVVSPKPTPKTTPKKVVSPVVHREKKAEPEASPKKPPVKTKLFDESAKKADKMEVVNDEEDDFETPKRKENQKSESTEKPKKKMETKTVQEEPAKKASTTPKKSKAVKEDAKEEEKPKPTKSKKAETEQKPKQSKAKKEPVVHEEEEEVPKPTASKKSKAATATGAAASKKRKREDEETAAHTSDHENGAEEKRPTKKAKTTKTTKKEAETNGAEETPKPTKTTKGKKAEETEEQEKPKKAKTTKKQADASAVHATTNKHMPIDMGEAFASIATLINLNLNNPNIIQEMKDAYKALPTVSRVIISGVVNSSGI